MNHRIVLSTTGTVLYIEAAMMLIPLLIAMGFKEHKQALAFLAAILIATGVGFLLLLVIYLLGTDESHEHDGTIPTTEHEEGGTGK